MPQAHVQTRQPSPPAQQLSPPRSATVDVSPLVTPRASSPKGHVEDAGRRAHGVERARASIACMHCRRSKTKCNNKGPGTTCNACQEKGKYCDYNNTDASATSVVVKRRESTAGDVDPTLPRKRKRPIASAASHHPYDVPKTQDDPLQSPYLTAKVWEELFDIYEKHFASDFPFLHRRRFLQPLHQSQQSIASRQDFNPLPRPPYSPPLLLGFLALTARYHPELVVQIGSGPGAAIRTAEYWAKATQDRLGSIPGTGSLERAQAMLFLGFHRWSDLKGENGWHFIGIATRYVQNLGYQKDEHQISDKKKKETRGQESEDGVAEREEFIDREIRRRTFWSCFILDRYTSCVESRVQMINVADIKTQLPCSDAAFNKGLKVRTRFLGESDEKYAERRTEETAKIRRYQDRANWVNKSKRHGEVEWEVGKDEAGLSLYIQTVNHFGTILAYSISKGRRTEDYPPWDTRSKFNKLERDYKDLREGLPQFLTLTPHNTDDHIYDKTSRNYVMIHALHTLCTIALYREYIAFAPWGKAKPEGPLDEPRITEPLPNDHPDYWIVQARKCFGAGKDFAELLRVCHSAGALVESTIAGWATYIVGWCAMYCHMFPGMDPDHALDSRTQPNAWDISNKILWEMGDRFAMPGYWQDSLARLHRHYREEKANWRTLNGSPGSTISDSGGGLQQYEAKGFESDHLQLGSQLDKSWNRLIKPNDWKLTHDAETEGNDEMNSPAMNFKTEETTASTPASASGFNAVNRAKSTSEAPSLPPSKRMPWNSLPSPSAAPVRPHESYDLLRSPQTIQTIQHPTADGAVTPSAFHHSALSTVDQYAHRDLNSARENGSDHPTSHNYWPPHLQQVQQTQQTPQTQQIEFNLQQIRQAGQHSVGMDEWRRFQIADCGYQNPDHYMDWNFAPHYQTGLPIPDSYPYEEGYPATTQDQL